jgi:hypothetical protein
VSLATCCTLDDKKKTLKGGDSPSPVPMGPNGMQLGDRKVHRRSDWGSTTSTETGQFDTVIGYWSYYTPEYMVTARIRASCRGCIR